MDVAFEIVIAIICSADTCQNRKDFSQFKQLSHSQVRCCFTSCENCLGQRTELIIPFLSWDIVTYHASLLACLSYKSVSTGRAVTVCLSVFSVFSGQVLQQSPAEHILAAVSPQHIEQSFKMWLCWQHVKHIFKWRDREFRLHAREEFFTGQVVRRWGSETGCPERLWIPHPSKCVRPRWKGLWATWLSEICLCPWQGGWNYVTCNVQSQPFSGSLNMFLYGTIQASASSLGFPLPL